MTWTQTGARSFLSNNQVDGRFFSVLFNRAIQRWTAGQTYVGITTHLGEFDAKDDAVALCESVNAILIKHSGSVSA